MSSPSSASSYLSTIHVLAFLGLLLFDVGFSRVLAVLPLLLLAFLGAFLRPLDLRKRRLLGGDFLSNLGLQSVDVRVPGMFSQICSSGSGGDHAICVSSPWMLAFLGRVFRLCLRW